MDLSQVPSQYLPLITEQVNLYLQKLNEEVNESMDILIKENQKLRDENERLKAEK